MLILHEHYVPRSVSECFYTSHRGTVQYEVVIIIISLLLVDFDRSKDNCISICRLEENNSKVIFENNTFLRTMRLLQGRFARRLLICFWCAYCCCVCWMLLRVSPFPFQFEEEEEEEEETHTHARTHIHTHTVCIKARTHKTGNVRCLFSVRREYIVSRYQSLSELYK